MDTALQRRLDALVVICAAILAFLLSSALFHSGLFFFVGWLLLTVVVAKAADWYVRFSVLWERTDPYGSDS